MPLLWFQRPKSRDNSTIIFDLMRSFAGRAASAIRQPDQGVPDSQTNLLDFPYMKAGILNQITYPTGGSTRFDYEANTYRPLSNTELPVYLNQDDTDVNLKTVSIKNNDATIAQSGQSEQSAYFEIKQPGFVKVTRTVDCGFTPCNSWNSTISSLPFGTVEPDPGNANLSSLSYTLNADRAAYTPPPSGDPNDPQGKNFREFRVSSDYQQFLPAGRYRLVVNNLFDPTTNNKLTVELAITYAELPATQTAKIGGGLRVRKITETDGADPGKDIVKSYTYQTTDPVPTSSGVLMSNLLQYHYKIIDGDLALDNGLFSERVNYQVRSSPTYPLSTGAQGSAVGYSVVSLTTGKASEGGKVLYAYQNTPDLLPVIPYIPDYPISNYNELNGALLHENAYEKISSGYRLLRTTDRLYRSPTVATVQGAKLYSYQLQTGPQAGSYALKGKAYSSLSKWNYDTDQTETSYYYDAGGNLTTQSALTHKYYENPTHYLPTRIERESSDGSKVGSLTTYPDDYASGSGFIDQMKSHHLTHLPIEMITYRIKPTGGIKILTGVITTYRTDCPSCKDQAFLLESASSLDKGAFKLSSQPTGQFPGDAGSSPQVFARDNTYKPRVTYDQYDANWNVLNYTADGSSTGLSWDATATFPTVVVQNAGGTPSLQTTYGIDPLLGVTQKTDPNGIMTSYAYDGLGRLQVIRNTQGTIVKEFAYHYRPVQSVPTSTGNQPPVTSAGISDQVATLNQSFTYTLPGSFFTDPEGQGLTYAINGLPTGLSFANGIISGTPSVLGQSLITVTATDPDGLASSTSFFLTVSTCYGVDPYIVSGTFASSTPVAINAVNRIETDAVQAVLVNPSASLTLKAVQSVRLLPGFAVKAGAAFRAYTGPCN